jgi:Nucleotidyltransferase domain.
VPISGTLSSARRHVFLFGSIAKGTDTRYSDIDLAVTGIAPEKFYMAMGIPLALSNAKST